MPKQDLERWFEPFRQRVIGYQQKFQSPFGEKTIHYADWTASGRLYEPIEEKITYQFGPFVGNTHTETTVTGSTMTKAYHQAKNLIKKHVGGRPEDVLLSSNAGMTGVVNKFQRILGLKLHENFHKMVNIPDDERPVVFVSHMEHHSNQTSWLETIAEVIVIQADDRGLMDLAHLSELLEQYNNRPVKIAAITSCSNVTGIFTPYYEVAKMMHKAGGYCFVDFACSAPYINIDMHPEDEESYLDAIYFSPHKFLGGPGATGILVFNPELYKNTVPDNPGGGTVDWTNPWGEHKYVDEIETREDGGTPAFLQTIKVALAVRLKEQMGVKNMLNREHEMLKRIWDVFDTLPKLHVLADNIRERLGVISFYIDELHYNLGVKLLNDRFGVQVRGGCSCAGTYGHYLLHVTPDKSHKIVSSISEGDLTAKPGWIRMSIHPVMTDEELDFILNAVRQVHDNFKEWSKDYEYNTHTNEFIYKAGDAGIDVSKWFEQ